MSKDHFRARQLIAQDRHSEALILLRKARAESPWSSWVAHDLAMTLTHVGRPQEATSVAEQMIADDPDDAFAHATLGLVQLRRELGREGEESFTRALALSPNDASIHGMLARAHLERGKPAEALAATANGLALEPDNDICLNFHAQALIALGRHEEAQAVSARLIELDPQDSHNHVLLGHQAVLSGRADDALTHFREALRLSPGNDDARQGLSLALKARSPIFSNLLRGLLALDRLGLWTLLGLLAVFLFGLRFLEKGLAADPVWLPVLAAVKIVIYVTFLISIIAHPLYDTLLSFDRDGRLALSNDELRATRWHLAAFAVIVLCVCWGATAANPRAAHGMAVSFVFVIKLIAEVFGATPGYVRKRMAAITIGIAAFSVLIPIIKVVLVVIALRSANAVTSPLIHVAVQLGLVPVLVGGFAGNIREQLERRRPDAD